MKRWWEQDGMRMRWMRDYHEGQHNFPLLKFLVMDVAFLLILTRGSSDWEVEEEEKEKTPLDLLVRSERKCWFPMTCCLWGWSQVVVTDEILFHVNNQQSCDLIFNMKREWWRTSRICVVAIGSWWGAEWVIDKLQSLVFGFPLLFIRFSSV